jgi:hypothetical protein
MAGARERARCPLPGAALLCACSLPVLLVLLVFAVRAPGAVAANVPNPEPALIERWEPCEPNTGVTVIVDDQNIGTGKISVGCAPGAQADGVEALQNAGFELEGTLGYGLAFICRIDGEPTSAETACESTPGSGAYWSYWRGKPGGSWGFSGVGAKSPQSAAPVNSVQGWSFGGGHAPRITPMDGSGPSSFSLPPAQESSVIPAALAREWLTKTLDETAELADELEVKNAAEHPDAEEVLPGVIALARAGVEPAEIKRITGWLARSCEEKHAPVEGCPLRELANSKEKYPERFALAVLGLQALGQNPSSFAGRDVRGELEEMVAKTGEVKSEGSHSKDVEVTAPTVLALARTGTLSEKDLKTADLILAEQNAATGSWETTTAASTEALEALAAAREQGAAVLGANRLERIDAAIGAAGRYLESIEEAGGGVREEQSSEAIYDPSVKSTALGAVGLVLSGHRAAAEAAAKWVSRYQVTAEYAGTGNPETGEHTPAEDVIGAFLSNEAALRKALVSGVGSSNAHGKFSEARAPTTDALLALAMIGPYAEPQSPPGGGSEVPAPGATTGTTSLTGSQAVLGSRDTSPLLVQALHLDGLGVERGLVGVSWRILEAASDLSSWTISSRLLGVAGAGEVVRATGGAGSSSTLVKLPPGAFYELQITFTDALGRNSTMQIGKVVVPYGVRWSGLRYRRRWRQVQQAGAWLGSTSRAGAGAAVSATLAAGRPVFLMRATPAAARVEVRTGSHRQVFAIAAGGASALRQITAQQRSKAGQVSLLVLKGTVDLDGVAVER